MCPFVRSSGISGIFVEKNIGGSQMPPSSDVLKYRFQNFLPKRVEVLLSKQNGNILTGFWTTFFERFWKKVETSHFSFQPLRARAVRGVSSSIPKGFEKAGRI